MRQAEISRAVLAWAAKLDRPLPWRRELDPYRLLVSEVMLQQTQAARVAPIYERFLRRFPSVERLAGAEAADVLRAWENLGYNRRALNLWRAARAVVDRGGFPTAVADLQTLPGVGPYTARAIASFAFGAEVAAVDCNVRRVVTRMHGSGGDVQSLADALVPRGRAAEWNQAMIDLGAEVCRARAPRCCACPLRKMCRWSDLDERAHERAATERTTKDADVPFIATNRYTRGRVVAALRTTDAMTAADLVRKIGVAPDRVRSAVKGLERDGLITRCGRRYVLGPGGVGSPRMTNEPGRAAASRR